LSAPPVVFKGSGWYVNDSRGDSKPGWGKNSSLYDEGGDEGGQAESASESASTGDTVKPRRGKKAVAEAPESSAPPAAEAAPAKPKRARKTAVSAADD